MSDVFEKIQQRLSEDPQLRAQVLATNSVDERRVILTEAGLEVPTQEDYAKRELADVSGGGPNGTETLHTPGGQTVVTGPFGAETF